MFCVLRSVVGKSRLKEFFLHHKNQTKFSNKYTCYLVLSKWSETFAGKSSSGPKYENYS